MTAIGPDELRAEREASLLRHNVAPGALSRQVTTLEDVESFRSAILADEPNMDPRSDDFHMAVAIMTAVHLQSFDITKISSLCGGDRDLISRGFANLRRNGVFAGRPNYPQFYVGEWLDEDGYIVFWMHVLVALGKVEITLEPVA